ncbi:MAG: hypothetical protein ASARMPRED_008191 [Alectoria sarmentosa]|nr:MAG: hypothetical protein ASARMPRED_008191 [Alectoria sarmentosa]
MEPAQSSRTEAPAQDSSPDQPRHDDGAEPTTQPTLPPFSTLRTGAPDPELPISSPTSTRRPHPSLVAEAKPSSAPSPATEVDDTAPRNVRAGKDRHVDRGSSTQAATTENPRHRSNVHHRDRERERLAKKKIPAGAAKEPTSAEAEKEEKKRRRDQQRNERRARKSRERRRHALDVDAITNRLSAVRTNEPERNVREENFQRLRCEDRAAAAQMCRAPELSAAGRAEQMRAVEQRIQGGAAGPIMGGGEVGEWESRMDMSRRHDLM